MWVPRNDSQAGGSGCGCHGMTHTLLSYAFRPGYEYHEASVTNTLDTNIGVDRVVICMYWVSEKQWRSMSVVSLERI